MMNADGCDRIANTDNGYAANTADHTEGNARFRGDHAALMGTSEACIDVCGNGHDYN